MSFKPRRVHFLLLFLLLMIGGFVAVIKLHLQIPYLEDIEDSDAPGEGVAWRDQIQVKGSFAREVDFVAYTPKPRAGERLPVFVYVGGYNIRPTWITRGAWAAFADAERFAIIGPFFFVDMDEFSRRESYHYPEVWSGEALDQMIARVGERASIYPDQIYLFGFSAGAQFVHRYALARPHRARGVVAHAPGQVTPPTSYTPACFLFLVGALDETRLDEPQRFMAQARRLGIIARAQVLPELDHRLSVLSLGLTRSYLARVRRAMDRHLNPAPPPR